MKTSGCAFRTTLGLQCPLVSLTSKDLGRKKQGISIGWGPQNRCLVYAAKTSATLCLARAGLIGGLKDLCRLSSPGRCQRGP